MTVADFSKQLKEGTKRSHTAAENTKFVKGFLRGVVNKDSYRVLITNFYFVYRAMEEEIGNLKDHPIVGPIGSDLLHRTEPLSRDLRYYYGPNWRAIIAPTEAGQQYVNRIREVAKNDPELLVAHHYTRYMGDLSGGQILKGIAEKAMVLRKGEGLHFYQFENITDARGFKESYRTILDGLPIEQSMVNAIVAEANYAFRLNMYMFDELQGNWLASFIKVLFGTVRGKLL
jgi:heme oxygenase